MSTLRRELAPSDTSVDGPQAEPSSDDPADALDLRGRRWREFKRNRLAVASAVFLIVLILATIFATVIAPHDPAATNLRLRYAPPGTSGHILGTDDLGRDILSRLLVGGRVSLAAGLGSVALGLTIAIPLGLVAGYFGGRLDAVVMWVVDAILAIPPLLLVFAIAGVLGPSLRSMIIALSVYFTPLFFRLVRGEVHALKQGQLVTAERALGAKNGYILRRHILPNLASPLIVEASLAVGIGILAEASMSFLGLGVQPPTSSWGLMLGLAFNQIQQHPFLIVVPATAIALTVLGLNLLGDGMRDALGKIEQ